MGFYGNISSSNKSAFSFDKTYTSRTVMDRDAGDDGVFLGRYVLVEYDEPPITAWYNPEDQWFYNSNHFDNSQKIVSPTKGAIYQDLARNNDRGASTSYTFYKFNGSAFVPVEGTEASTYTENYSKDLANYGRGYDSTAWMKRYDAKSGVYSYVLISEMNAVVPNFHLMIDPPEETPDAPYFDRDSTNIDYYLHQQPLFGNTIRKAQDENYSDETVTRNEATWKYDENGAESVEYNKNSTKADIFYNKEGFHREKHTEYSIDTVDQDNTINYEITQSGRKYKYDKNAYDTRNGAFDRGSPADDTKEWYIRLPALGNTICAMWDGMYGYDINDKHRYTEFSSKRADDNKNVSYNTHTLMGVINRYRDLFGYTIAERGDLEVGSKKETPDNILYYDSVERKEVDTFDPDDRDVAVITNYYYYAYSPDFELDENGTYYKKSEGNFALANTQVTVSGERYKLIPMYQLTKLADFEEDSLAGLIISLHRLIGTGDNDSRDENTIIGSMNIIKDIVDNIGRQLVRRRLIQTNPNTGMIETSNTEFPVIANLDQTKVLQGNGEWSSRFSDIEIKEVSEATTELSYVKGTIQSDTDHNNKVEITPANKWVRFAVDSENDNIKVAHTLSALKASEIKPSGDDAITNIQNDNKLTLPVFETDNAGHVVGTSTTDVFVPHNFKTISIKDGSGEVVSAATSANGDIVADNIVDTLSIDTQNKWIQLNTDANNDKVAVGHRISPVAIGSYGLKENETITTLDKDNAFEVPYFTVDEAGHVTAASTQTVTLPENFTKITTTTSGEENDADLVNTNATIEADNLTDEITLDAANRWIKINASADADKIQVAHLVRAEISKQTSTGTVDGNDTQSGTYTIDTETVSYDKAGHIVGTNTRTNTISFPKGFKTIAVSNYNNTVEDTTAAANGDIVAKNQVDTLTVNNGNTWIEIAANRQAGSTTSVDNNITFSHKLSNAGKVENKGQSQDKTCTFNDTFKVPYLSIDEAGHVNKLEDHEITLPKNSIEYATGTDDKNVITSVGLNDTNGIFTFTKSNIGTLALTDYTKGSNSDDISATDTVNDAFSKLQNQIKNEQSAREGSISEEATARQTAIGDEKTARENAIKAEKEERENAINNLIGENLSDDYNTLAKIEGKIKDAETARENAINEIKTNYYLTLIGYNEQDITINDSTIEFANTTLDGEYVVKVEQFTNDNWENAIVAQALGGSLALPEETGFYRVVITRTYEGKTATTEKYFQI